MSLKPVASVCALLLLAGCGALPSSGPSVSDVRSGAYDDDASNYLLVDVDLRSIDQLASLRPTGMYDSFGDGGAYSAAPDLTIGVGDAVAVSIWEVGGAGLFGGGAASSLRGTAADIGAADVGASTATVPSQIVSADGAITVPFAGRVHVAGKTPAQAEAAIRARLEGKAMEPQVLVTVLSSISGSVSVMGEVTGGARIPLSVRGDRLLDVIASAGGIRTAVHETTIQLTRDNRTASAPLQALLDDPRENVFARPGDVITVSRETRTFTVLGATGQNAELPFTSAVMTLAQAMGRSGGLLDNRSDAQGIFIFRFEQPQIARGLDPRSPLSERGQPVPVVYRLDLTDPRGYFYAQRFALRSGDVIYVSNAPLSELQKVFSVFGTLTSPVLTGAGAYNAIKD